MLFRSVEDPEQDPQRHVEQDPQQRDDEEEADADRYAENQGQIRDGRDRKSVV